MRKYLFLMLVVLSLFSSYQKDGETVNCTTLAGYTSCR